MDDQVPALQRAQSRDVVKPAFVAYVPDEHGTQLASDDAAIVEDHVPALHIEHTLAVDAPVMLE